MSRARKPTIAELFNIVEEELEQSVSKPNIFNYGEKDYPEQERFHRSTKKGRFVSGGNRAGKTDAIVVEGIFWAADIHPFQERPPQWGTGPIQLRYVVVDISKGVEQIMLPKFKRWLPKSLLVNGKWKDSWNSNDLILTLSNGSTIDFVTHGMELSKLGGVPRHGIFFDEEPPQDIFNESMMRLIDYKGFWVIAATPVKGIGWTYDLLWEPSEFDKNSPIDTFVLRPEDNPYILTEAKDFGFYMMGMDKEEREIRQEGSFVARSGLVFPNFAKEIDKYTIDHIEPPKGWSIHSSADFGLNNPTAWLWHAVSPNGDIYTFAEHYQAGMVVEEHVAVIKERERAWGFTEVERCGDPAGKQRNQVTGTSVVMEYAVRGIYINVEGIPHDVMIGIEKMHSYFRFRDDSYWGKGRPKWVISKNCPNLIRELKKLRWATYASERMAYDLNKQEVVHKKDDHAFDSARYFATTRPDLTPVPIERTNEAPTTVSYEEIMAKLSEDPTVSFLDSPEWEVTTQIYEEEYVG